MSPGLACPLTPSQGQLLGHPAYCPVLLGKTHRHGHPDRLGLENRYPFNPDPGSQVKPHVPHGWLPAQTSPGPLPPRAADCPPRPWGSLPLSPPWQGVPSPLGDRVTKLPGHSEQASGMPQSSIALSTASWQWEGPLPSGGGSLRLALGAPPAGPPSVLVRTLEGEHGAGPETPLPNSWERDGGRGPCVGRTQGPGCPGQTEAGARWRPGYLVTLEARPRLHFLLGTSTSNQATLQGGHSLGSVTSHSHPSGEPPPPGPQEQPALGPGKKEMDGQAGGCAVPCSVHGTHTEQRPSSGKQAW